MSTLLQQIRSALAPIVNGQVWYGQNMQEPPVYPYVTFLFVVNSNNISFDGPSDVQGTRVQVDVISRDPGEARAVAEACQVAMLSRFVIGAIDEQDFPPDPDVKAFRSSTDYSVWSRD